MFGDIINNSGRAIVRNISTGTDGFGDRDALTVQVFTNLPKWLLLPTFATMIKNRIEIALKNFAGVFYVFFGIGGGDGQALKRIIQKSNNAPLFWERGNRNDCLPDFNLRNVWLSVSTSLSNQRIFLGKHRIE